MNALSAKSVPPVFWQDKKVITTELLARLYETEEEYIRQNYSRNADRFTEGKHFFKVAGQELKDLRPSLRGAQISAKARSIMFWTERGAARHAKMLETNKAWDVFEALEDHYFDGKLPRKRRPPRPVAMNTRRQRNVLRHLAVDIEIECRLSPSKALQFISCWAGVAHLDLIPPTVIPEAAGFAERAIEHRESDEDWVKLEEGRKLLSKDTSQMELLENLAG